MDLEFVCGEQGLWADIMRNEYLRSKDLLVDEHRNMSQFWNAIQKVKLVFCLRAKHQVRNGSSTRLWFDWWQGSGPSKERFPSLFALAVEQDCSITRANVDGTWRIPLPQALGQEDLAARESLGGRLGSSTCLPTRISYHGPLNLRDVLFPFPVQKDLLGDSTETL
jgi:hypothetical protein